MKPIKTQGNFVVTRDGQRVAAFATESDMLLFEAAEGLLKACKEAYGYLSTMNFNEDLSEYGMEVRDAVEAAIDKVEGGSDGENL